MIVARDGAPAWSPGERRAIAGVFVLEKHFLDIPAFPHDDYRTPRFSPGTALDDRPNEAADGASNGSGKGRRCTANRAEVSRKSHFQIFSAATP
jgi:hypothetical protein